MMIILQSILRISPYRDSHWLDVNQSASKMEIRSFVITILIVALAVLHCGEATKCYSCTSQTSKTCESEPDESKETIECPSQAPDCGSCIYKLSNGTSVTVRTCGYADLKPLAVTVDNVKCSICKTELCNNANMATISMAALGCLVSFWTIQSVFTNFY